MNKEKRKEKGTSFRDINEKNLYCQKKKKIKL